MKKRKVKVDRRAAEIEAARLLRYSNRVPKFSLPALAKLEADVHETIFVLGEAFSALANEIRRLKKQARGGRK